MQGGLSGGWGKGEDKAGKGARAGEPSPAGVFGACESRSLLPQPGLRGLRGREGWRPGGGGAGSHGRGSGRGGGLRVSRPAGPGPGRAGLPGLRAPVLLRRGRPPSPSSWPQSRSGSRLRLGPCARRWQMAAPSGGGGGGDPPGAAGGRGGSRGAGEGWREGRGGEGERRRSGRGCASPPCPARAGVPRGGGECASPGEGGGRGVAKERGVRSGRIGV